MVPDLANGLKLPLDGSRRPVNADRYFVIVVTFQLVQRHLVQDGILQAL
jgi:hypothetical protein